MDIEGEWYGPGTACYVMRDLVALHQQRQTNPSVKAYGAPHKRSCNFRTQQRATDSETKQM